MEKTNSPRVEMESDDVDIKHEPLEADMEYYVSMKDVWFEYDFKVHHIVFLYYILPFFMDKSI